MSPFPQCIPLCVRTQWVKCNAFILLYVCAHHAIRDHSRHHSKGVAHDCWDVCGICFTSSLIFLLVNTPRIFDQALVLFTRREMYPCQEPCGGYPSQPQAEVLPSAGFALRFERLFDQAGAHIHCSKSQQESSSSVFGDFISI